MSGWWLLIILLVAGSSGLSIRVGSRQAEQPIFGAVVTYAVCRVLVVALVVAAACVDAYGWP